MLHCCNPHCQVANAVTDDRCQSCQWPLVRRFLWAVGPGVATLAVGDRLADRYQVVAPQWILDTAPARPPRPLGEVPALAEPYLGLLSQGRAVPQPFTVLSTPGGDVLLLEGLSQGGGPHSPPTALPALTTVWPQATALQQLAWLWQIAHLWEPLAKESVAAALLNLDWLRVDGSQIYLQQLATSDPTPANSDVTLAELGALWHRWVATAQPSLRPYLDTLSRKLTAGEVGLAQTLDSLTQALETLSAASVRTVEFATASDQGPTRQRNEDACYPASGSEGKYTVTAQGQGDRPALIVVCDGIGGHQGGDVASRLTIEAVTATLNPLLATPNLAHETLLKGLKQAILQANQTLSQQNDQAHRQARDRMGTTLVIAVVYGARLYIAHLGDSRAYWVRPHGCYQLTLDDDVATRDARLGYSLYREALLNPGAGSLVQAIGMADSQYLRPTVQMRILGEAGLLLICSDGLSDNDLIERTWTMELLPIAQGERSVGEGTRRLVDLANRFNGHDNVTVALLRLTVPDQESFPVLNANLGLEASSKYQPRPTVASSGKEKETVATLALDQPRRRIGQWRWGLGLLGGVGVGVLLGVGSILWQGRGDPPDQLDPSPTTGQPLAPGAIPPGGTRSEILAPLTIGQVLQISPLAPETVESIPLTLTSSFRGGAPLVEPGSETPAAPSPLPDPLQGGETLVAGSQLQVLGRRVTAQEEAWVRVRVCTLPGTPVPPLEAAYPPGVEGWILEATLLPRVTPAPPELAEAGCPVAPP